MFSHQWLKQSLVLNIIIRNYGLIFIGYGIGAFVGPKISASFFDATGSYVMGFIGSAILAAVAVLLVVVAKKLANKMLNA